MPHTLTLKVATGSKSINGTLRVGRSPVIASSTADARIRRQREVVAPFFGPRMLRVKPIRRREVLAGDYADSIFARRVVPSGPRPAVLCSILCASHDFTCTRNPLCHDLDVGDTSPCTPTVVILSRRTWSPSATRKKLERSTGDDLVDLF